MKAPSGTPPQHRRRRRDLSGSPHSVLAMLLLTPGGRLDPGLAAIACQVTRQTILQSIHRLRGHGLVIKTYPEPPGPHPVRWYQLDDLAREKAWQLLHWWTEPAPKVWDRYTRQAPKEPTNNEPASELVTDRDAAHAAALDDNPHHW